jgi:methionyl-tRNA formyltransferase
MKTLQAVLLMSDESGARLCRLANEIGISLKAEVVGDLKTLTRIFDDQQKLLLSFGTSVIVPACLLEQPGLLALNVHAASPDYPGRDPHHFAVYDGATKYGATVHFMTSKVDAGPIVDMELFDVPTDATPASLLDRANQAAWVLLERLLKKLAGDKALIPLAGASWGTNKTTRKMFIELCRIDASMTAVEFARRLRATSMPGFSNLYMEVHGHCFRIQGKT